MKKYFITGGSGFIGAHLAERLLSKGNQVTVYDNLSNGRLWYLDEYKGSPLLNIVIDDVKNEVKLQDAMRGHDAVYHLASNADIAKAATDPDIDFFEGIYLTRCVLEAMRKNGVNEIYYTSGSGVYGEVPPYPVDENFSPMIPVSTYGAQKLGSEALISSYSYMFEIKARVFRFANVVGPRQTHGVAYDFIKKLTKNKRSLEILGDGTQTKPYIHIEDILNAIVDINKFESTNQNKMFEYYNVGTEDSLTVTHIAEIVRDKMNLNEAEFVYTGGARGWKADVPVYSLDTSKLRKLGWASKYNSYESVELAVSNMISDISKGKILFEV